MKILVLTGAGASRNYLCSADNSPLTTESITKWVINDIHAFVNDYYRGVSNNEKDSIQDTLMRIHDSLRKFHPSYNFETFIHLVDLISDLYAQKIDRLRTPTFSTLSNTNFPLVDFFFGQISLPASSHYHSLPHNIRSFILEKITNHHTPSNLNTTPWSDFYLSLIHSGHNISIADLNYDSLQFRVRQDINKRLPYDLQLKNGFERIPSKDGFSRFDGSNFQTAENILMHLHGSIYFYQNALGLHFTPNTKEAMKYRKRFAPTFPQRSQTGSGLHSQFMITGFNKAEAVSQSVFAPYYIRLVQEIDRADLVILIGYGGGDTHINMLLSQEQYRRKKYVIVSFADHHRGTFNIYLSRPSWKYLNKMVPKSLFDQNARMHDYFVSQNNAAFTFKGVEYFLSNFKQIIMATGFAI